MKMHRKEPYQSGPKSPPKEPLDRFRAGEQRDPKSLKPKEELQVTQAMHTFPNLSSSVDKMRGAAASKPEQSEHREETSTPAEGSVGLPKPIKANINFSATIDGPTGEKPPKDHFGITRTFWSFTSYVMAKPSAFEVMATIDNRIEWQVVGPGGLEGKHIDIESADDSDITTLNYEQIVKDLTPDLSDEGGRPPRDLFWARDLVITHEQFHANDRRDFGKKHVEEETKWLNEKTAETKDEARELTHKMVDRARSASEASMAEVGEPRAYGAGVPDYLSRTTAITEKGRNGGYK